MHELSVEMAHLRVTRCVFRPGNAFLTHMVRIMAGTLFRVGVGQTSVDEIADMIASEGASTGWHDCACPWVDP